MEQGCIAGLYQSLGISAGGKFSSEDVNVLFHKVFHVPSTTDDVHMAIKKIAGDNEGWSCVGENILDVLLEMEKERERKEKLYWDLQLLNVGKLNTLYMMDTQDFIDRQALNSMHAHTDKTTFKKAQNRSDSGSKPSRIIDTDLSQRERLAGKREQQRTGRCGWRLKKAARQCWARLVAEGVHSILPSLRQDQGPGVKSQAWGSVSLSDLLLLVEVKYDVVAHMLYTEMLQEHYSLSVWETLLPWQRDKEEVELEDLAEEALESGDMLRLAELPGAFRIYRAHEGVYFRGCPDSREQSWSAITLLFQLHMFRLQERDTLPALSKSLDKETLRLLCLYIRFATLRAQKEKMSYGALLAARQSWETWPYVSSPCKTEQVALWLHSEEEEGEEKEDPISASPQQLKDILYSLNNNGKKLLAHSQQAVLQWLVLSQELERKYLLRLLHGVSLEDLQGPGGQEPPREDKQRQTALREDCIRRLRQIHTTLQTQTETQIRPEQNSPHSQPQSQPQILLTHKSPQLQIQAKAQIDSLLAGFSQTQWGTCALVLLTQLMELHEIQVSAVLPALLDMSPQRLRALRDEYESELQEQRLTSLLQLLTSDAPLTSDSVLIADATVTQNSKTETITAQYCSSGSVEAQNSSTGPVEAQNSSFVESVRRVGREPDQVQAEDDIEKLDVCTGCGAPLEDLPYLEILCVSDTTDTNDGHSAEGGALEEQEDGSSSKTPQSYEKQASLITLAWSKPPEDDTDYQAEAVVRNAAEDQNAESNVKTVDGPGDIHSTAEHTHCKDTPGESHIEVLDTSLFQSGSRSHPHTQLADQQCTVEQDEPVTVEERPFIDQPEKRREAPSESDLQMHALVVETLEVVQPHLLAGSPDIKQHPDALCSELSNERADVGRVRVEVEDLWELKGPEPPHPEDDKYTSQATVDYSFSESEATRESMMMEREQTREPVSVMERERTMRSLVDIQRKMEQRQQRDRERQLLRVQERLSIIQNRKAEEDLLGLKQRDRLRHLTHNLPQEDKRQQKAVVRERLEQLRRERSNVMQSKRDRNTAGFKELLGPVALHGTETEDGAD